MAGMLLLTRKDYIPFSRSYNPSRPFSRQNIYSCPHTTNGLRFYRQADIDHKQLLTNRLFNPVHVSQMERLEHSIHD